MTIIKILHRSHFYSKILLKVKCIYAKDFLNEINCIKPEISNTVWKEDDIENYLPTVMFRGTSCIK